MAAAAVELVAFGFPPKKTNAPMEMVGGKRSYLRGRSRPYYHRRCKNVNSPPYLESLPDDLLSEILVRVPAHDLHDRARLVCRRWYRIISSVAFANTHLHHSSYGLVVVGWDHNIYVSTTKQGQIEVSRFDCKRKTIASPNGLVLEFHPLRFSNPATKKSWILPDLPCFVYESRSCSVAYGASSMEYKVVLMHINDPQRLPSWNLTTLIDGVDKYSSRKRQLEVEHIPYEYRCPFRCNWVATEGFLHWTSRLCGTVLSLDMETEIIKQTSLPLPACASIERFYYLSTGRNLSVLFRRRDWTWEVWEMIPEAGEWRECTHFLVPCHQNSDRRYFWPLGWVKYPDVLACGIGYAYTLIFYNLRTHEIDSSHAHFQFKKVFLHRNTLQMVMLSEALDS